jgi:hypothetical protein
MLQPLFPDCTTSETSRPNRPTCKRTLHLLGGGGGGGGPPRQEVTGNLSFASEKNSSNAVMRWDRMLCARNGQDAPEAYRARQPTGYCAL